jgi:drug/metabolite transporter (DMT)-like permease
MSEIMMKEQIGYFAALFSALVFAIVDKLPAAWSRRAISTMVTVVIVIVIILAGMAIIITLVFFPGASSTTTIYP